MAGQRIPVLAAVALALLGSALPSFAKARVCNLVKDGSGDAVASFVIGPNQPNAPSIDIISGDVATSDKYVGVAIRVADIAARNPHIQAGEGFEFFFARRGADPLLLRATKDALGAWKFEHGVRIGPSETIHGAAHGVVDAPRNELRMWIEQSALGTRAIRAGLAVIDFKVSSYDRGGVKQYQDSAPGDGSKGLVYTAGAPTCVPLGK